MTKEKKPKVIWDNCKFIGEVKKSDRTKLRVEIVARDGVKIANIREWYMRKSDKEWKPGMMGFAVPVNIPMDDEIVEPLAALVELLQQVINEAPDFAIEDEDNKVWSIVK